jgi:hypothetical protein
VSEQSLILLDGWKPPVLADFVLERQAELKAALALYKEPITRQEQADEVAALIAECERWESDVEEASFATRTPYREHAERIKALTDAFWAEVYNARQPVQNLLAEWETQTKIVPRLNMENQALKEAEATGQPMKPITWEAPKTEGVKSIVVLEYEFIDERAFAEWCWANGRSHWVRRIEFEKRPITEELGKVPDTAPVPQIPGLAIRRVASVRVAKAKREKVVSVTSTRVEL